MRLTEVVKEYDGDRLDSWDRIGKLTVGDLLRDIGDHNPDMVAVEYAGCGSHTIMLMDMDGGME